MQRAGARLVCDDEIAVDPVGCRVAPGDVAGLDGVPHRGVGKSGKWKVENGKCDDGRQRCAAVQARLREILEDTSRGLPPLFLSV